MNKLPQTSVEEDLNIISLLSDEEKLKFRAMFRMMIQELSIDIDSDTEHDSYGRSHTTVTVSLDFEGRGLSNGHYWTSGN